MYICKKQDKMSSIKQRMSEITAILQGFIDNSKNINDLESSDIYEQDMKIAVWSPSSNKTIKYNLPKTGLLAITDLIQGSDSIDLTGSGTDVDPYIISVDTSDKLDKGSYTGTAETLNDAIALRLLASDPRIAHGETSFGWGNHANAGYLTTLPTHNHDLRYFQKSEITTFLTGKENAFSKNTAFNKNFGTTVGTVAQGNDQRLIHGEIAYNQKLVSMAFSGSTNKTLTVTLQNGDVISAGFNDLETDANGDTFLNSGVFNYLNGNLNFARNDGTPFSVNLDGRYSLTSHDHDTTYASLTGSYSNPNWITSLAWSKISGKETTLAGYGITDASPLNHTHSYLPLSGGTLTGKTLMSSNSGIKGTSTENANISYYSFYESDGTTTQGYIGFSSASNSHLYIKNETSSKYMALRQDGILSYNGGMSLSGALKVSYGGVASSLGANMLTFKRNSKSYIDNIGGTRSFIAFRIGSSYQTKFKIGNALITSDVKHLLKSGSGIQGTGTGNANSSYFTFYAKNGTTTQGYIGFASKANSHLYIKNETSSKYMTLRQDGILSYNGAVEFSQTTYSNYFGRKAHSKGHLVGGYNNLGVNKTKTNPIYTIGGSYNPNDNDLSGMYGIGFSNTDASFINSADLGIAPASGWGLYVASDGNARIFLNSSTGNGHFKNNLYAENGMFRDTLTSNAFNIVGSNFNTKITENSSATKNNIRFTSYKAGVAKTTSLYVYGEGTGAYSKLATEDFVNLSNIKNVRNLSNNHTIVLADNNGIMVMKSTAVTLVSIPTDALDNLPIGFSTVLVNLGKANLIIKTTGPGNMSVRNGTGSGSIESGKVKTIIKIGNNHWMVYNKE